MDKILGKKVIIIISALIPAVFLASVWFFAGIWFETNDDVFIAEMLSGKIMGVPEYHCPYVSSIITVPITFLYRIFNAVPWWGLFILLVMYTVLALNIGSVLTVAKHRWQVFVFIIIEMCVFVAGIHCFSHAQFTCVSILLAITGYVVLYANREKKSAYVIFAVCELLACCLRYTSMMLVQPLGFMGLIGMGILEHGTQGFFAAFRKKVIITGILSLSIIGTVKLVDLATFRSEDWKDYYKYNEIQEYALDYDEAVSYEAVSDILEKYDITEKEYEMILDYRTWFLDNKFSGDCLDELLPRFKELRSGKQEPGFILEAIKQLLFTSGEFWHLHQLTTIFFVIVSVIALIFKKYKYCISALISFVGYFIGIVFLAYRNRTVLRVMMPYYLGALLILCVLLFYLSNEIKADRSVLKVAAVFAGALITGFLVMDVQSGRVQFAYARRQNNYVNKIYRSINSEIADYCRKHPENSYIQDMSYARYASTDVFDVKYYKYGNYIYSGSWYSNIPPMIDYSKEYIRGGCCYLVYEAQELSGMEGAEFYAEKMNTEPVLEDKFKIISGATIWVYRIEETEKL